MYLADHEGLSSDCISPFACIGMSVEGHESSVTLITRDFACLLWRYVGYSEKYRGSAMCIVMIPRRFIKSVNKAAD